MSPIKQWVVVMFENRSFDSLLGHLPHIPPEDGLVGRVVDLPYPGGTVRVHPSTNFTDPIPDPGEEFPAVNVQLFGRFVPESNAGKSPYRVFPDYMAAPYNSPAPGEEPTMDGFALDFYFSGGWERGVPLSDEEMKSIGGVFTPETAPVINALAAEYAVFTRWFCDAPTCTFPNRSFFHCGTSGGLLDNRITYDYAWDFNHDNLFQRATHAGVEWRAYYDPSQKMPLTAINLGGGRHLAMWRDHSVHLDQFWADAAAGTLPEYAWVEPNMLFGELNDYHPPTDIRAAEAFLAQVYEAVRNSPQWESTALVVMFDEHGGCYDHVPPPSTVSPDDLVSPEGFTFDRLGVRVPTIVISPYVERGTVVRDVHSNTSMTRTLREALGLGEPLTRRDAWAKPIHGVFTRATPRTDRPRITALPYVPGKANPHAQAAVDGDIPDAGMWKKHEEASVEERISTLGHFMLRNAAELLGHDPDSAPTTHAAEAREWLQKHFIVDDRFEPPVVAERQ